MSAPFLQATGQSWKTQLGWPLLLLGGGVAFAGQHGWLGALSAEDFTLLTLGGAFLGLGALFWMMHSIRCPRCNKKLLWYAANQRQGLYWFDGFDSCPGCRYSPKEGYVEQIRPR